MPLIDGRESAPQEISEGVHWRRITSHVRLQPIYLRMSHEQYICVYGCNCVRGWCESGTQTEVGDQLANRRNRCRDDEITAKFSECVKLGQSWPVVRNRRNGRQVNDRKAPFILSEEFRCKLPENGIVLARRQA